MKHLSTRKYSEIVFDVAFLDISLEENSNKTSVSENTKKGI
jgi:hypothetical protein